MEIAGGMDVDCGSFVGGHLGKALAEKLLTEQQLDAALTHLFSLRMRLGLFDPPAVNPYSALTAKDIDTAAHRALALQAAQESLVLLENRALPLDPKKFSRIAVVGPNSDNGQTMQGVDCHGTPPYLITPTTALRSFGNVTHINGCGISSCPSPAETQAAVALAAEALSLIHI